MVASRHYYVGSRGGRGGGVVLVITFAVVTDH